MEQRVGTTDVLRAFIQATEAGESAAIASVIRGGPAAPVGGKLLVKYDGTVLATFSSGVRDLIVADCLDAIAARQSRLVFYSPYGERLRQDAEDTTEVFIDVLEVQATLLIAGAGHIALPLAKIGSLLGFHVAIIDDRPAFATKERFEEADEVIVAPFLDVLRRYPIGPETYIVIVTRGHRHDEDCLRAVIDSPAAYIGMIGSRRRSRTVLQHLAEAGASEERLAGIHTPIGLDIGAESPAEIAVAIIAEVVKVRRGGRAASLSDARRLR